MAGHQRTADTPAGSGRAEIPAGGGQADRGGGLYYGWAYMLTLGGKGGYGGSPNVEAGKMYQQGKQKQIALYYCTARSPHISGVGQ
jgi:hypothetical protein